MLSCKYETKLLLVAGRNDAFAFPLTGSKRLTLPTWEIWGYYRLGGSCLTSV